MKLADKVETFLENFISNMPRMNTMHFSKLNLLKQPNNRLEDGSLFDQPENHFGSLVPVKIELEVEAGKRIKEILLWDKNEPYLDLESFAKIFIEEQNLSSNYEQEVLNQLKRQLKDFRGYKIMTEQVPLSHLE